MATLSSVIGRGVVASRPAAGTTGQLYFATDVSGGQLQRDNGSTWDSVEAGGGVTLTTASNLLSADVTMTTANTFYDGPSLSLVAGTWLLTGGVTCSNGSSQTDFTAKLWDGTTVYSSGQTAPRGAGGTVDTSITLTGIVSPGSTTTYKISVAGDNASSLLRAACGINGAGNNASYLYAVKVA